MAPATRQKSTFGPVSRAMCTAALLDGRVEILTRFQCLHLAVHADGASARHMLCSVSSELSNSAGCRFYHRTFKGQLTHPKVS